MPGLDFWHVCCAAPTSLYPTNIVPFSIPRSRYLSLISLDQHLFRNSATIFLALSHLLASSTSVTYIPRGPWRSVPPTAPAAEPTVYIHRQRQRQTVDPGTNTPFTWRCRAGYQRPRMQSPRFLPKYRICNHSSSLCCPLRKRKRKCMRMDERSRHQTRLRATRFPRSHSKYPHCPLRSRSYNDYNNHRPTSRASIPALTVGSRARGLPPRHRVRLHYRCRPTPTPIPTCTIPGRSLRLRPPLPMDQACLDPGPV